MNLGQEWRRGDHKKKSFFVCIKDNFMTRAKNYSDATVYFHTDDVI